MREIKFRGKGVLDNEFHYGFYAYFYEEAGTPLHYICDAADDSQIVYPDTVGQYTGLKDKHGVEIYEGDIVKTCEGDLHQVIWKDNGFKFLYEFNIRGYDEKTILGLGDTSSRRWGVEIIGNIYENLELLKEEE